MENTFLKLIYSLNQAGFTDESNSTLKAPEPFVGYPQARANIYFGYDEIAGSVVIKEEPDAELGILIINEAEILMSIDQTFDNPNSHPNIQRFHKYVNATNPSEGIVLEYGGISLDKLIWSPGFPDSGFYINRPFNREIIKDIGIQLLCGLGFLHSKGIIYRDMKPANVTIEIADDYQSTKSKIIDLGLAVKRNNQHHSLVNGGTDIYMSPEQLAGDHLTPSSDLYSVGCTLYEMITGEQLMDKWKLEDIFWEQLTGNCNTDKSNFRAFRDEFPEELKKAGIDPTKLATFFQKALKRSAKNRYQIAEEMAADFIDCF